jgi:tRNA-splicing ligase RtcB (3'-phosphate/5'-hydroxy nucleic acid ligase)
VLYCGWNFDLEGEMSNKLDKLETLIPLEELEYEAQEQIFNALEHDFVEKVAIMPDCHTGYSMPIGGVALTNGVISPAWIGYDQNCGVCCVITKLKAHKFNKNKLTKVRKKILERIPVGFNTHKDYQDDVLEFDGAGCKYNDLVKKPKQKLNNQRVNDRAKMQVGSLGGGNHMLELGVNNNGFLSIVIHSGSRNLGHQIATFYMNLSKHVDTDLPDGFFHLDNEYGQAFLQDLAYSEWFAYENRKRMMAVILEVLGLDINDYIDDMINEHHNHAIVLDGGKVIHRKGATSAYKGQLGLIPIDMSHGTYITVGLGNEKYLSSASHGAGRKMSRTRAKENVKLDIFEKQMKDIVSGKCKDCLDEAPDAYKSADLVIGYQKGIVVDIIDHIKPLVNIKG